MPHVSRLRNTFDLPGASTSALPLNAFIYIVCVLYKYQYLAKFWRRHGRTLALCLRHFKVVGQPPPLAGA